MNPAGLASLALLTAILFILAACLRELRALRRLLHQACSQRGGGAVAGRMGAGGGPGGAYIDLSDPAARQLYEYLSRVLHEEDKGARGTGEE